VAGREQMVNEVTTEAAGTRGEADELRGAMVDDIVAMRGPRLQLGLELPDAVVAAMRAVPRHLFTPDVTLVEAYESRSVITKTNAQGVNVSAVSAPWLVAWMLAQLDVRPGQSVLEIGSGGYNAALLREIVGPDGSVTSVDIDPSIIGRARAYLDRAGYGDVRTLCADGESGAPGGPFDRIIVTFGAWDIPPAWSGQLAADGRLVVPLRLRGLTRSWVLERENGHLASRGKPQGCEFVPAQGAAEHDAWSVEVDKGNVLLQADEPPDVDGEALAGVLTTNRAEAWSGVTAVRDELILSQDLSLITSANFCWLTSSQDAVDRGLVRPLGQLYAPALASDGSLAYRATVRAVDDEHALFEFGAHGHGPQGAELAQRLAEQIRVWDRDHRHGPGPVLTVHPADTPSGDLPDGSVINKSHTTVVLSYPKEVR